MTRLTVPTTSGFSKLPRSREATEVVVRDGIRVTSPVRSIVDAAEGGTDPKQVIAAVMQAVERGMANESQLLAAAAERAHRVERLVRRALKERPQR